MSRRLRASELPRALRKIDPDMFKVLLPTVSVSAEENQPDTHCHRITFTVTLRPGFFWSEASASKRKVKYEVIDQVNGVQG